MHNDKLEHYGILGMKWGVRRNLKRTSVSKKQSKKQAVKKLSDEELRKRVNRLQMERQYEDLTRPRVSAGRKLVNDIIAQPLKGVVAGMVGGAMALGIKKGISYVNTIYPSVENVLVDNIVKGINK
jgi:hypothetical protein